MKHRKEAKTSCEKRRVKVGMNHHQVIKKWFMSKASVLGLTSMLISLSVSSRLYVLCITFILFVHTLTLWMEVRYKTTSKINVDLAAVKNSFVVVKFNQKHSTLSYERAAPKTWTPLNWEKDKQTSESGVGRRKKSDKKGEAICFEILLKCKLLLMWIANNIDRRERYVKQGEHIMQKMRSGWAKTCEMRRG